jgi:hypothetical protein
MAFYLRLQSRDTNRVVRQRNTVERLDLPLHVDVKTRPLGIPKVAHSRLLRTITNRNMTPGPSAGSSNTLPYRFESAQLWAAPTLRLRANLSRCGAAWCNFSFRGSLSQVPSVNSTKKVRPMLMLELATTLT